MSEITQGSNIIHDPKIKRIIEYDKSNKQINLLDQRFYRRNNKYYPSVTSILNYFPKNAFFHTWLKDVGHNSDIIAGKAANEGTQTHNAIEQFLLGKELIWIDSKGKAQYPLDVWKMILRFAEFWKREKPELISTEYHVFSDKYKFAGTTDIICRMDGKIWLLDIKTSNHLHTTMDLQLSAYVKAWNEMHNECIEEAGILWLKSKAHKENNKKVQGKGWELKPIEDINKSFDMFMKIYDVYNMENKNTKPYIESLPTSIKL